MGYKKDIAVSKALFANGFFRDRRSYVSLADTKMLIHFRLFGVDEMALRDRVFAAKHGLCDVCKVFCRDGELHHPGIPRCDCVSKKCPNRVEWRHGHMSGQPCHRHGQPGFDRHAEKMRAKQDFAAIYGADE